MVNNTIYGSSCKRVGPELFESYNPNSLLLLGGPSEVDPILHGNLF